MPIRPEAIEATDPIVPLARVQLSGVAGAPDVTLELGPVTALIGTRGSGKSQLLVAISWLLQGRPEPALRSDAAEARAVGSLGLSAKEGGGGTMGRWLDGQGGGGLDGAVEALPRCSFLRAAQRLGAPMDAGAGEVGGRLGELLPARTTDAAAAEALIEAVEGCCRDGLSGEVLLVEEPELLLTPQAQRYLYRLLRRFGEAGNQVVYSTWSPAFIDAAHHAEIVRLDLRAGVAAGTVVRRTDPGTLSEPERVRLLAEFDHERSEMFFAQRVVLVEGRTERHSLPFVFRALGHDPDAEGIAIVEMGGKGSLPLAARILRQLAIPFVVVFDADGGADAARLDAEILRAAGGAPTIRLDPDFEAAAGLRAHDDKVFQAWRRFAGASPEEVPAPLAEIVRATIEL